MKAMGYRVSPNEVEGVLSAHPAVAEVGVAELPVRADVSVICGFVVLQPGAEPDADGPARVVRRAARRLQAPARDPLPRRPAAHRERQGAAQAIGSGGGGLRPGFSG